MIKHATNKTVPSKAKLEVLMYWVFKIKFNHRYNEAN